MAIPSPVTETTDLVSFSIIVNGAEINGAYQIVSIAVENAINRIPYAKIQLLDGSASTEDFEISDSVDFIPGNTITINAGYHEINTAIFSGIIVKHSLKITSTGSLLVIECRDSVVKMTVGRKNAAFINKADSDVISDLITTYAFDKTVAVTQPILPEIVQYYVSDWDFMVLRADINGLIVTIDQGKIGVAKPDTSSTPVILVTYGESLISIDAVMDAGTQLSAVQSSSWDVKSQAVIQATSADPELVLPGNISSATLAAVMAPANFLLQSTVPLSQESLQGWADARLVKSQLAKITGTANFQGTEKIKPGVLIKIQGIGNRFSGNVFVSSVKHKIEGSNWTTEAGLGWSADWFAESHANITSAPASAQIPGIQGLQNGVVVQIDNDPDGEFRVLVKIPLINTDSVGIWARMAQMYATNNAGSFFYPEIGDEVLLGFLNDDPRFPIILGSIYSSTKAAPFTPDKENINKGLVSKNQLKITFDDKNLVTSITTPKNNSIILSESDEKITITDQNKNTITMASAGITMQSVADINIKASGDITFEATGNINVKATGNTVITGLEVSATAETSAKLHGNASAELSAAGQVTVQGAMVMIN